MDPEFHTQFFEALDRLTSAAGLLEQAAQRIEAASASSRTELAAAAESQASRLDRVVATVESDLVAKLAAAEHRIAELEARAAAAPAEAPFSGRKTVPASAANLFSKHGMTADSISAGALDSALVHLSLEQRIAVKAELMRSGLLA